MILSDREIQAARARAAIRLTPEPLPVAWSSTAVDLSLDAQLSIWDPGAGPLPTFCPHSPDYDFAELSRQFARDIVMGPDGYVMPPHSFLLGWTVERLQLPHTSRIAARVEGKSSLARLGLGIHVTAPTIHAGFGSTGEPDYPGSPIRLEIWNIGPLHIKLEKGLPVCQLIFEWVDGTPEKGYGGRFNIQGPDAAST